MQEVVRSRCIILQLNNGLHQHYHPWRLIPVDDAEQEAMLKWLLKIFQHLLSLNSGAVCILKWMFEKKIYVYIDGHHLKSQF